MKSEHIIDERATIPDVQIDDVYEKCLAWIRNRHTSIREKHKPTKLVAYHRIGYDFPREEKIIRIDLSQGKEGVSVRLIMDASSKVARRDLFNPSLTATSWSYLVESLWDKLGIEMDVEWRKRMYPRPHLDTVIAEKRSWTILRCFISIMIIALGLYDPVNWILLILFGLGYFFYTIYKYYQFVKIRGYLYPNKK